MKRGLVVSNLGSRYEVLLDETQEIVTAAAKGNLRIKGIRTTNPVAVGDCVLLTKNSESELAYITSIEPRRNYIIRRASNLSKESHILASNIDLAILVATLRHPETSTTFIDRFLATAEAYDIPAMLVINKIDLLSNEDSILEFEALSDMYRTIGYPVIAMSVKNNVGLDELRDAIIGKTSLLAGNSGVGKSTIINALIPNAEAATAAVSDATDSGTHTTTFSRMYELPEGGKLIDIPGVRGFGTLDFDRHEVSHFFPEIFAMSDNCRFSDCLHTQECPGCAVMEAVENFQISPTRYASYLSILEESVSANKYR